MRQGTERVAPEVLVDRIRSGDSTAEAQLVAQYSRAIRTMLEVRTGGDVQHAEDLHQETFLIVLQRLRTRGLEEPGRLAAYLHKTASNLLIADFRKDARRRTHADSQALEHRVDPHADQLRELIRTESDDAVRQLIQELRSPRDRELMYRFYILQQEKPMICKAMGLSVEHFDRVISRARSRFRALIKDRNEEPGVAAKATAG